MSNLEDEFYGDETRREIVKRNFTAFINTFNLDVITDTPDHILAEYLLGAIENYGRTVKGARDV